jgi:hypothetical protein
MGPTSPSHAGAAGQIRPRDARPGAKVSGLEAGDCRDAAPVPGDHRAAPRGGGVQDRRQLLAGRFGASGHSAGCERIIAEAFHA